MASRVERPDGVGGPVLVLAQADDPRAAHPEQGSGVVVLPPAQLITQAQENLGLDLPSPTLRARGGSGAPAGIGRQGEVQNVLRGLVGVPLATVAPASGAGPTPDTVRRYFFERRDAVAKSFMRDHGLTTAEAEAAADQWVARNVARWEYQRREHRGDGLRALTAAGMLIAIANAGGNVDPRLLEVARATQAAVRERLIEAAMTPGADRAQVAAQVDAYLGNLGTRVNASTAGWGEEVRILRAAEYYRPFNPQASGQQGEAIPFAPPHYTQSKLAQVTPTAGEAEHVEAMRRADRVASAEHAVREEQRKRADLRAHVANLEAQGRPVGGPTYG